jgi:ERCC4-type nuclease
MAKESRTDRRKKRALNSHDPNRILWLIDKASAYRLYRHSLNVATAASLPDNELLSLKGVGRKTVRSLRSAIKKAKE